MFDILASYKKIGHAQIEICGTAIGTDDIRILIANRQENATLLKETKDSFQAKLGVIPTFEFEQEDQLIHRIYNPLKIKPTFLLDKRD